MKPRKILIVKPSKYERSEALRSNKKYWQNTLLRLNEKYAGTMLVSDIKHLSQDRPNDLCEQVCNILDYDIIAKRNEITHAPKHPARNIKKEPFMSNRKSIIIERELESDTDVEYCSSEDEEININIHQQLLRKPEREQITWNTRFLQPEREDEKSLIKKANDVTERLLKLRILHEDPLSHTATLRQLRHADACTFYQANAAFQRIKIAQAFCEYMKDLGGDQQSQLFTAKSIKELFQVEFDTHVSRSLQVVPKELPTIIDKIATVTGNVELSRKAALGREISKDIKAEKRPENLKAFGQSLPKREQWRSPKNDTKNQWCSARHVPKDLVSLKTVWEGITNIRSVREYCRWMIQHPEHRRAPYLNSLGMFDPAVLNARLTMELQQGVTPPLPTFDNAPAPIEQLRRRLSQLAD